MDTESICNSRYQRFCEDVRGCYCRKNSGSSSIKEMSPRRHVGIQCDEMKRIGLAPVYFIGAVRALVGMLRTCVESRRFKGSGYINLHVFTLIGVILIVASFSVLERWN